MTSWWVGLSREELKAEIPKHVDGWAKLRIGFMDTIAEQLRQSWEPRHVPLPSENRDPR